MCSQVYHGETAAPLELFEQIALRIAKSNLGETTRRFSTLHRASGTPDAEEAADYLLQTLEEYGIPHRRLRFTGYMRCFLPRRRNSTWSPVGSPKM